MVWFPLSPDVGGNPYIVDEDTGYLLAYPAKADEAAAILRGLVFNTKLLKQKGEKARDKAVAQFNLDSAVKRLIEIYKSVR